MVSVPPAGATKITGQVTTIVYACVPLQLPAPVACTVNEYVPAVVAVPLSVPVAEFNVTPGGRAPPSCKYL